MNSNLRVTIRTHPNIQYIIVSGRITGLHALLYRNLASISEAKPESKFECKLIHSIYIPNTQFLCFPDSTRSQNNNMSYSISNTPLGSCYSPPLQWTSSVQVLGKLICEAGIHHTNGILVEFEINSIKIGSAPV